MGSTVIGSGLTIEGEVSTDDDIVIEGTLRGKLQATGRVSIEGGGHVEADVHASAVSVGGQLTGMVVAGERVDVLAGGKLVGDVKAARFTIADGASFKGNVDMDV